jgi:hypothetical protein
MALPIKPIVPIVPISSPSFSAIKTKNKGRTRKGESEIIAMMLLSMLGKWRTLMSCGKRALITKLRQIISVSKHKIIHTIPKLLSTMRIFFLILEMQNIVERISAANNMVRIIRKNISKTYSLL